MSYCNNWPKVSRSIQFFFVWSWKTGQYLVSHYYDAKNHSFLVQVPAAVNSLMLMDTCLHHPTQTTTQQMKTAPTSSPSPLALSSCWNSLAWIYILTALLVPGITSRLEMAHQMAHLSWANCVAVRSLHLSNQATTICGWSKKTL